MAALRQSRKEKKALASVLTSLKQLNLDTGAAVTSLVTARVHRLARKGTVAAAIGLGVLAAAVGLAGGPVARAALAVLAAATDVLTAESALARPDPS